MISQAIDLTAEVRELQRFNSQELSKLLKDSDNLVLHITKNGSSLQIEADKLLRYLPLHLTAVLLSSKRDEASLRYLLSGFRLLYSLCEIASRHPKLEQILLDDLKLSEQLLDLVFYLLILFSAYGKEHHLSGSVPLLYSALVACSMYLLTACVSSQWHELAYVLLAHPKVDIFIDAAFGAVRRNINFLHIKLSADEKDIYSNPSLASEKTVYFCCQQCEASLQFLQSLCQHKSFRERVLRNKELCGKGGVLRLAQAALKLDICPFLKESRAVVAAVSRLKARVLSILLYLCEAESVSYLDEVASIPESLDLTKSVAVEVIALSKTMLSRDPEQLGDHCGKTYPMGLLQLNALRLVDIFSDDSNFRSYITVHFADVLEAILSIPYQEFLFGWCSSDLPMKEEDASMEYEPFAVAGWILDISSPLDMIHAELFESNLIPTNAAQASYAHQRTSLLVKVIANLHCFVPKICKEQERNLFLHKFLERLKTERQDTQAGFSFPSQPRVGFSYSSASQKAATVCKNLRALLGHAESLIPTFLNEEDVQLLRVFFTQLQSLIYPAESLNSPVEYDANRAMEVQSARGFSCPNMGLDRKSRNSNLREGMSDNTTFPGVDNSCLQGNLIVETCGVRQGRRIDEGKSTKASSEVLADTKKDVPNAEISVSDSNSARGKNIGLRVGNSENNKSSERLHLKEDEKVESVNCEEKQLRKRKRPIMNDKQVAMMERALQEEPDMQKNAASLQSWAETLSFHGSEVTSSQLKNWLNNRKARLARAAKDGRTLPEEENPLPDEQDGLMTRSSLDSPGSIPEELPTPFASKGWGQVSSVCRTSLGASTTQGPEPARPEISNQLNAQNDCSTSNSSCMKLEAGQAVVLTDTLGKEIAKGKVYQVEGEWHGCNLSDTKTCVVDITELKSERIVRLPHPSIEAGATFEEAEIKVGNMRVLWDTGRMAMR